ncbi:ATP-binding protein [Acaryochloris sp. IP29b_bin.148]|uniref:ATP-binding protein n=1 Tax=Acaryochloris sp. IP29b_bin.148 TaxID=2969218 RepID=UPI00261996A8|nr:ATP-binding protein [Acaryochloris sp. IP29b_bin.148]
MLIQFLRSYPGKFARRQKLRTILIVPFVLQVCGAVGLVGYLSFRNGQASIEELAQKITVEVEDRIAERTQTYLAAPHAVNQLNQHALELGQLQVNDLKSMERHFWRQIQVFDRVSYIQFGTPQGEFVGLAANDDGTFTYQVTEFTGNLQTYSLQQQGQRGRLLETSPNFVPHERPWYTVPEKANQPAWTDIYAWVNPPTLAITLGQPYYDLTGQFQGIIATDLTIAQFSDFLRNLKIGKTGKSFILERSGLLVATSTAEQPFTPSAQGPQRLSALDSQDAITRSTTQALLDRFGNLPEITHPQQLDVEIQGQRFFIQVSPLRDQHGLDWLSVVVVPEADFMEQIYANTRSTIGLSVAALLIAILIGIATARWVTRPILKINQAATAISAGDLDQNVALNRSDELGELARSFNHMVDDLRHSLQEKQVMVNALQDNEQKLAEYNRTLEQQVQQRSQELIQSEKMVALGQLTAGVAHEINTPLGAIQAAGENIASSLEQSLQRLPQLLQQLNQQESEAFFQLLNVAQQSQELLTSREERQLRRTLKKALKEWEIASEIELAGTLSKMGIFPPLEPFLPVLQLPNNTDVLEVAYDLTVVYNNTQNIRLAVGRAAKIVFALKSYARQDLNNKKVKAAIPDTVETVLTLYHNQLKQGIEVTKVFESVPDILCYPEELAQVWTNLLHNAMQAMDYNGQIEIGIQRDQDHIVVHFTDSGCGIPEDLRAKIFDPFFTTKPVGEGSGLGLDIVRKIVEKHQGRVECQSQAGHTKFEVWLPIATA